MCKSSLKLVFQMDKISNAEIINIRLLELPYLLLSRFCDIVELFLSNWNTFMFVISVLATLHKQEAVSTIYSAYLCEARFCVVKKDNAKILNKFVVSLKFPSWLGSALSKNTTSLDNRLEYYNPYYIGQSLEEQEVLETNWTTITLLATKQL